MHYKLKSVCIASFFIWNCTYHACCATALNLDQKLTQILVKYVKDHHDDELLSGVTVSVGWPNQAIASYSAGTVSRKMSADLMLPDNLFQIGSITKSFTAAIILQLEHEGKLNINQKLGQWLPDYPHWKNVTIKQLLNMTSRIPDYTTVPKLVNKILQDKKKQWSDREIVDIVYNISEKTKAYNYSNTNYLILSMIINKATKNTFTGEINSRLIAKYNLNHTLYYIESYPKSLLDILSRGYYYGKTVGSIQHGEDVTATNMSAAGAGGALLSTSEDIVRWVRLLFSGKVLASKQQQELTELISVTSGQPMKSASLDNDTGFGLGIMQAYNPDMGNYWFYKGETIGYRALYLWNPCNNIIVAIALNSSPFDDEKVKDHSNELLKEIYKTVVASDKKYACINTSI